MSNQHHTSASSQAGADIVTKVSPRSVADTVARLSDLVAEKGLKLFALIDLPTLLMLKRRKWSAAIPRRHYRVTGTWVPIWMMLSMTSTSTCPSIP